MLIRLWGCTWVRWSNFCLDFFFSLVDAGLPMSLLKEITIKLLKKNKTSTTLIAILI